MDKEGYMSFFFAILVLVVIIIVAWHQDSKRKTQAIERLTIQDTSKRVQDSLYQIWYNAPHPD